MMAREAGASYLSPWLNKWSWLIALSIFALSSALLLHKSLLPQYTLVPLEIIQDIKPWDHLALGPRANRLIIDPFFIFYPNRALQTASILGGRLPFWNPYLFTGTPVIADPNFQPFYLPNLLASLVLPVHLALPWLAWIHLTLSGMLMYLFLRKRSLHWLAASLGGGVWLLNGYLVVWLENPHRLSTAAWLPGVFWAYEEAIQEKKPAWAALAGIFLAMAILGGQVQFVFIFGLALIMYAVIQSFFRMQDSRPDPARPLLYLLLVALIGFLIGALVIIPAAEFSTFSQRTLPDAANFLESRWPATHIIALLAPDLFGNPATEVRYWGAINYAEVTAYFGVVALLLALSAVFVARDKRFLFTTLFILALVLAVALGTPLARVLSLIPGFQFLALRRTIILIPFFGAWLAAAGLDGWLQTNISWRRSFSALALAIFLMAGISFVVTRQLGQTFIEHRATAVEELWRAAVLVTIATLLLLAVRRRPLIVGSLLLILALGELLQWGRPFNPITSIEYLYPENAVTDFLKQDPDLFRVLPLQAGKTVFGPNTLSTFEIEDITGYSSLIKGDYAALLRAMDDDIEIGWMRGNENMLLMSHFHPLVSMLNVKYVLSAEELPNQPELQPLAQLDGVWVYENKEDGGRAFLVNDVQPVSPESVLPTLLSPDFDWRQSALITEPLPAVQAAELAVAPGLAAGNVTITCYEPEEIIINVDSPQPAFLVLTDAYYPGWQAFLDDQPVTLYETNDVLRGLYVPAGLHEVQFRFRPRTLQVGLVLALAGLSIALIVAAVARHGQN